MFLGGAEGAEGKTCLGPFKLSKLEMIDRLFPFFFGSSGYCYPFLSSCTGQGAVPLRPRRRCCSQARAYYTRGPISDY